MGDHCTDDTEARVAALGDPRIRFHNLPMRENDPSDPWESWAVRGSVPRSVGIEMARGRWIAATEPRRRVGSRPPGGAAGGRARESSRGRLLPDAGHIRRRPAGAARCGRSKPSRRDTANGPGRRRSSTARRGSSATTACARSRPSPTTGTWRRRAWEAGVRFHHVSRDTVALYVEDRQGDDPQRPGGDGPARQRQPPKSREARALRGLEPVCGGDARVLRRAGMGCGRMRAQHPRSRVPERAPGGRRGSRAAGGAPRTAVRGPAGHPGAPALGRGRMPALADSASTPRSSTPPRRWRAARRSPRART